MEHEDFKQAVIVNLWGGPGIGKSSVAYGVSYLLKKKGISFEYIGEYAKSLAWSNDPKIKNQLYVTTKQIYQQMIPVLGGTPVVVTDSPILLGTVHRGLGCTPGFDVYMKEVYDLFDNLNILLVRNTDEIKYDPNGRTEKDVQEAIVKDNILNDMLNKFNIDCHRIVMSADSDPIVEQIVDLIVEKLKTKQS